MTSKELIALSPQKAWQLLQTDQQAILVDIRSTMEFLFVGHPLGAVHIPWIDEPEWTITPCFVADVRKLVLGGAACDSAGGPCAYEKSTGCSSLILICRSGKRSKDAGRALLDAGFSKIYHVDEGFEGDLDAQHHRGTVGGWRLRGLPWEQC